MYPFSLPCWWKWNCWALIFFVTSSKADGVVASSTRVDNNIDYRIESRQCWAHMWHVCSLRSAEWGYLHIMMIWHRQWQWQGGIVGVRLRVYEYDYDGDVRTVHGLGMCEYEIYAASSVIFCDDFSPQSSFANHGFVFGAKIIVLYRSLRIIDSTLVFSVPTRSIYAHYDRWYSRSSRRRWVMNNSIAGSVYTRK